MRESVLVLRYGGAEVPLPLASARQADTTLEPIDNGEVVRTWNGDLIDLTRPEHRKYDLRVSASGMRSPPLDHVWRGQSIEVDCIDTLRQFDVSTTITLERDPVPGSVAAYRVDHANATHAAIPVLSVSGRDVTLDAFSGTAVVEYRPRLQMKLVAFNRQSAEWDAEERWNLELLEA